MSDDIVIKSDGLQTLNKEQIAKITTRLPELHRGKALIGHSTSQTSYSLQTMQMISDSPLSRMKQCLAQISHKYDALKESYFNLEKKKLELRQLIGNTDAASTLKIKELESGINSASTAMENALRQIGMFQDMYDSIRINNNIPENWTEKDYEKQEIEHMIKSSFRLGLQDLMAGGRVSKAAVEYWEQLGINPQVAETHLRKYLLETQVKINDGKQVDITDLYKFYDEMHELFKYAYQHALTRMGLDQLGSEQFMAEGVTKPT